EIQEHDDSLPHVDELLCEEQVALQMCSIDDVQDNVGFQNDVACHPFLIVERRDTVYAGGIIQTVLPEATLDNLDGRSGIIRDFDIHPAEIIEDEGLADIGVADKDDPGAFQVMFEERHPGVPVLLIMGNLLSPVGHACYASGATMMTNTSRARE